MAPARSRSGITRRALGRRTTASASTTCCFRPRRRTNCLPRVSTSMSAAGKSRPTTSPYGSISPLRLEEIIQNVPGQLVVHAEADDVIAEVQALTARKRQTGRRVEIRFVLQPDVEIFHFRRPVLVELDLDTSAGGPAPMPLLVGDLADGRRADRILDIGKCAAAGGIQQPVVLRVPDPAAERRKPVLPDLVVEDGVGREFDRASFLIGGGNVALEAEHHRATLNVEPGGKPDNAAAQVHARRLVGPRQVIAYDGIAPGPAA